jgi:hypothetical protein
MMAALSRDPGESVPQASDEPSAWGAFVVALILVAGLVVLIALNMN